MVNKGARGRGPRRRADGGWGGHGRIGSTARFGGSVEAAGIPLPRGDATFRGEGALDRGGGYRRTRRDETIESIRGVIAIQDEMRKGELEKFRSFLLYVFIYIIERIYREMCIVERLKKKIREWKGNVRYTRF